MTAEIESRSQKARYPLHIHNTDGRASSAPDARKPNIPVNRNQSHPPLTKCSSSVSSDTVSQLTSSKSESKISACDQAPNNLRRPPSNATDLQNLTKIRAPQPPYDATAPQDQTSPCYTEADELDLTDPDALIKLLETADTTDTTDQPVPEGLSLLINSLCTSYNVDSPVWAQSLEDWRNIIILGRGVNQLQQELDKAKEQFPEFQFTLEESGPQHTKQLCSNLLSVEHVRVEEGTSEQIKVATAACELILRGQDQREDGSASQTPALYAAVPAHLILSDGQCEQIIRSENPMPIESMREEVNSQIHRTRYLLNIRNADNNNNSDTKLNLNPPAMIGYRHYYKNLAPPAGDDTTCITDKCPTDTRSPCPHTYMNDIAIIQLERHLVSQLLNSFSKDFLKYAHVKFDGIARLNASHIKTMIEDKKNIAYIGDVQCTLVTGFKSANDPADASRTYADHIEFRINTNNIRQVVEGDSGTILYIKVLEKKLALGMMTGRIQTGVYQAILLCQALKDIEIDYRHMVAELVPIKFQPLCAQSTARPPSSQYNHAGN